MAFSDFYEGVGPVEDFIALVMVFSLLAFALFVAVCVGQQDAPETLTEWLDRRLGLDRPDSPVTKCQDEEK